MNPEVHKLGAHDCMGSRAWLMNAWSSLGCVLTSVLGIIRLVIMGALGGRHSAPQGRNSLAQRVALGNVRYERESPLQRATASCLIPRHSPMIPCSLPYTVFCIAPKTRTPTALSSPTAQGPMPNLRCWSRSRRPLLPVLSPSCAASSRTASCGIMGRPGLETQLAIGQD